MTTFSAKYYDGWTSRAHDVVVRSDESGTLHVEGLESPAEYPLSDVRIAPRLGDTVRSLAFSDGSRCETNDHAALAELEQRLGGGKGRAFLHWMESRWPNALVATVLLALLIGVGVKWGIPVLTERVVESLPDALVNDLGRGTLAFLDSTWLKPSALPEERRDELEASFASMARSYHRLPLKLAFRRAGMPNAFALPDGTVVVTDELVALSKNDQQIFSVLAHEIGHVHHRHSLRIALESSSIAMIVSAYLGDAAQVTTLSASLPAVYAQAHYSRELETEADTFALEYMDKNGISRHHFADILKALSKAVGEDQTKALQYLSSHPPTAERIRRFEP